MSDNPPIHVVAGVIQDARGRILLTRRTLGRDLAGLWEFPGGKVEKGETAAIALGRELREELDIEVQPGEFLISVPQAMPHKRIVLEVHRINRWQGRVRGLDGQALAWVLPEHLGKYPMPPADRPVVAALRQAPLCLVTPSPATMSDQQWLAGLDAALAAGIGRIQLRAPDCAPSRWRALLDEAVARARGKSSQLAVNGDAALAEQYAIGLHLPERLLMARKARDFSAELALSAACHHPDALRHAEAIGCDYAVVGQIKPSTSHPGAPGMGWAGFARLREVSSLPLYAIGGLGIADMADARAHGAQGIAAIRALWQQGQGAASSAL
ncbi:DNA mismatch repair protein MutT [Lysobacteraceae bacterium NML08-0793]|nr:DNA mismatch repair protein MutT [Xanthomonadaceae bacterium NML08-0793]